MRRHNLRPCYNGPPRRRLPYSSAWQRSLLQLNISSSTSNSSTSSNNNSTYSNSNNTYSNSNTYSSSNTNSTYSSSNTNSSNSSSSGVLPCSTPMCSLRALLRQQFRQPPQLSR